jgi:beta-fructofuranosidase
VNNVTEQQPAAGLRVSRRSFLLASTGLLATRFAWSETEWNSLLCWRLDEGGDTATESVTGTEGLIASRTGHATWVGQGSDRALRLDGYSVWVNQQNVRPPITRASVTLSAWLALESYPVNTAAIISLQLNPEASLTFAVDPWGVLQGTQQVSGTSASCASTRAISKSTWHHVAVAFTGSEINLYLDGTACGHSPAPAVPTIHPAGSSVWIGRSPDCEIIADVFRTGVLNGLLKDVRVFNGALSPRDLNQLTQNTKPAAPPDLQINGSWCSADPHRPVWHAMPPRAWTNEPHGLIRFGGKYHLFYQKNPNGPYWGHINWGHLTSDDLCDWTEMRVALSPEPGPDKEGCWSGSVIDFNEKLAILYTGGDGHRASICLALSDDGLHFKKHPGNPVIPQPPQGHGFPEFRDPFVWREGGTYYLIIGSAITGKGGTALLYRSPDLVNWEYRKPLLVGDRDTSGVFWEMPIFVRLGDLHALIVCEVPGRASYWVGKWEHETFTPISAFPQRLELFNHLLSPTPHTLEDGRVIAMGIIPDERSPKECWRAGWAHLYSMPRLISADASGRLHQQPYDSVKKLGTAAHSQSDIEVPDGSFKELEAASGTSLNIRAKFARGHSQSVTLRLRSSPDGEEFTDLSYWWDIGRLVLDRTHSSLDPDVKRDSQESTWFPDTKDVLDLDIYLDRSVLELFVEQRSAFAARIYPTLDSSDRVFVSSHGPGARINALSVIAMGRPKQGRTE